MDEIRHAIVQRLEATPAVTSLLGAPNNVFHRIAPRGAIPPYVVLHRQAETDEWTFSGPALEHDLWTVKAICRGSKSDAADDIAQAITVALNDAPISVVGYRLLYLRRESKIDFGEPDGADFWHHVGSLWRLDADPL